MAGRHRNGAAARGLPVSRLSLQILASVATVASTAGMAGLGTYGEFSSTTSADLPQGSGAVALALGATGAVTNRLTVAASNLVPGDTVQRTVDLVGTSTDPAGGLSLTTTAPVSSVLDTDTTNGLHLWVEHCSVPWTETVVGAGFTYTCSGTARTLLGTPGTGVPVIQSSVDLLAAATSAGATLASLNNGTDRLRVTLRFPSGAGNTLQSRSSTIRFAFTLTQRAGTAR